MAAPPHQKRATGTPKAPSEEVRLQASSIDDDCSVRTVQVSNARRVTRGENRGGPNQDQEQEAQPREDVRSCLRSCLLQITATLSYMQKKLALENLFKEIDTADADSTVPLSSFQSNAGTIRRLHDNYAAHPETVKSVVSIALQEHRTAQARRLQEIRQERRQERQNRMGEISRLLEVIFDSVADSGNQIAHIVEVLLYKAVATEALSFESLAGIVADSGASAEALEGLRQSADEFIGIFNENFHDSETVMSHLDTAIQSRGVAGQAPVAVGSGGVESDSSLSASVGMHLSGDSSSHSDPPWLGRYFNLEGHGGAATEQDVARRGGAATAQDGGPQPKTRNPHVAAEADAEVRPDVAEQPAHRSAS